MSSSLQELFDNNRAWSEQVAEENPNFFPALANQQSPEYLWIGCSDSRVAANQLLGLMPGEVFVHRNIANVVVHSDLNSQSVMQYAVEALKVKHIIVCGHYGCGGVKAALGDQQLGLIDNWLRHIRDVANCYGDQLAAAADEDARFRLMCELNVMAQVANVCHSTVVQNAWKAGQPLEVHGLVYDVADGLLKDLNVSVNSLERVPPAYRC